MATTFKTLSPDDVTNTKTLLYEQIPLTGTIMSGTYSEQNILSYSHGMFQSVYDYPHNSSSANHLFDITAGISKESDLYIDTDSDAAAVQRTKKLNIYNQMAKVLYGCDTTGSIKVFDRDGNPDTGTDLYHDGIFVSFSRLLVKDEIKKGSFKMKLGLGDTDANRWNLTGTLHDYSGSFQNPGYLTNSPVGEYGVLFLSEAITDSGSYNSSQTNPAVGLIFYQAGIIFISTSLFATYNAGVTPSDNLSSNKLGHLTNLPVFVDDTATTRNNIQTLLGDSTINGVASALRRRINKIEFQNTTELNSTIYFLRVNNNEFNYSSNPTYLTGSEIRVKGGQPGNSPIAFITTAGLYSPDNELLAVAKLSQPLQKTEEQSMILRVRLDY